jgi:hypothetical protein
VSCLGVHFSLDAAEAAALQAIEGEQARLEYMQENFE